MSKRAEMAAAAAPITGKQSLRLTLWVTRLAGGRLRYRHTMSVHTAVSSYAANENEMSHHTSQREGCSTAPHCVHTALLTPHATRLTH